MKEWKDILVELAKKLTALFAFVVMLVIVIALLGKNIPEIFSALVYILAIGGLLAYSVLQFIQIRARHQPETMQQPAIEPTLEATPVAMPAPHPLSTLPPTDAFSARERYLRAVIKDCSTMRLAGVDPNASDPNRSGMSLEKLYISLDTQTPKEKPEEDEKKRGRQLPGLSGEEREPLSALEAWLASDKQRMVLLGLPGTGKSTFVRYLSLTMAKAELSRQAELPKEWKGRALMPFMVSLGRFAETLPPDCNKGCAELVEEYLVKTLKSDDSTRDFAPLALQTLENEGGLVMFDGLDEVASLGLRPLIVQAVEDFFQKYSRNPSNFFLVTCRTYSYQHDAAWKLTGWATHELALLSREKIEYFVKAWYEELTQIEPARKDEYARKRKELLETLQPDDRRRLLDIAVFPLILTIMAVVHTHFGSLPDTRAEVYERCVELLLIRWQSERSVEGKVRKQSILDALDVSPTVLYQALWEVAYKAHSETRKDGQQAALVTEDLLDGVMKVYLKERDRVETFLEYCQSSNGLLMLQGTISTPGRPPRKVYAFPHLTFEEYLAARYLANEDPDDYAYKLVGKSDRWRESIKLLGEHLCFGAPSRPTMSALMEALAQGDPKANEEEQARMTWLAGDLLVLYNRAFPSKQAPSAERIFAQLKEKAVAPLPDPRIRANCADLAAELGHLPDDLYDFVEIHRPSSIVHRLFFAKHPVTNLQYARFLEAEDFHAEKYWTAFPKYSEPGKKGEIELPDDWGDEGYRWLKQNWGEQKKVPPRYWTDPRLGLARKTAPVVGVTWYEANAYCKWLLEQKELPEHAALRQAHPSGTSQDAPFISHLSSFIFRLPTETEWVLAAGGEANGRFPWDEKGEATNDKNEILRRANTSESGIGRTTPAGMYPLGRTQSGIWDLAGNVWECQANFQEEKGNWISRRGGSWGGDVDSARVSFRLNYHSIGRWDYYGFRLVVVVSPPR